MGKILRTISGTNEQILAQLEALEKADKKAESTWKYGCLVMFLGGLSLFVPGILGARVQDWQLGLCLVAIAVGIGMGLWGGQGDVDDSRYQALQRLHRFLSGDGDKNTLYHYVLDLRPYTHRTFYLRTEKFGDGWFSLPRGKFDFYDCPVLHAQVKLRDGTTLSARANRLTKKRTRTKTGRSGKVKTKVVEKYSTRYRVSLKLPDGPPVQLAPNPQPGARLDATIKGCKAEGRKVVAVSVQKGSQKTLEIDGLLQLMARTFHQIHLHRQSAS